MRTDKISSHTKKKAAEAMPEATPSASNKPINLKRDLESANIPLYCKGNENDPTWSEMPSDVVIMCEDGADKISAIVAAYSTAQDFAGIPTAQDFGNSYSFPTPLLPFTSSPDPPRR